MTVVDKIRLRCPVCKKKFCTLSVLSYSVLDQDTDFCPRGVGLGALPHLVHVCPNCYFAAFEGGFDGVEEGVREAVLSGAVRAEDVVGTEPAEALAGSTRYLLAARCYERDSRCSTLKLADLYLRASWCARQEGRREREREAQQEAVIRFEKAVEDGEVEAQQLQVILYLMGELYRRIGLFRVAVDYFDQAASVEEPSEDGSRLGLLIKHQREAAVQRCRENMVMSEVFYAERRHWSKQ
jgi:uncharacterized protein (DUF2225 family)